MRNFLLAAITAYQRYLSPCKGFRCAYHAHTGRASCSALGFRAVRRYGVVTGLALLRRRVHLCGVAHRRYGPACTRPHRAQRGDCDIGCDLPCDGGCDLPGKRGCSLLGDLASCGDCGSCDWPDRKRKDKEQERQVYIPPPAARREGRASDR